MMLTIRPELMADFEAVARQRFVSELRVALARKYPHCLPSFPVPVQEQIVRNMLGRASRWGITWKSALVAFAETMLAIAPNFDEHAEVRVLFRRGGTSPNRAMLSIDRRLSKIIWREIEHCAQDLPLFVPTSLIDAPVLEQTVAAIPIVLGDFLGEADPVLLATSSLLAADNLGLNGVMDAGLVLTARKLLYATQLRNRTVLPWVADIFETHRSPMEIVSMLKLRISIDFGRFV